MLDIFVKVCRKRLKAANDGNKVKYSFVRNVHTLTYWYTRTLNTVSTFSSGLICTEVFFFRICLIFIRSDLILPDLISTIHTHTHHTYIINIYYKKLLFIAGEKMYIFFSCHIRLISQT